MPYLDESNMQSRMLVLWCPDWPITALGYSSEALVSVATGNKITACSALSRAAGVHIGLRRKEAENRLSGLRVIERDLACETQAFETVLNALSSITPRIQVIRPGLCITTTHGPARYFGGEEELCNRVRSVAKQAIAIDKAPDPKTGIADGSFVAILAAYRNRTIPPGKNREFLAPIAIEVLGDPDLSDALRRLGVVTLGAFSQLSTGSILARFGSDAARLHRIVKGTNTNPLDADNRLELKESIEKISAEIQIDPPTRRVDTIVANARSAAIDLFNQLEENRFVCTRIRVEMRTEHGKCLAKTWENYRGATTFNLDHLLRQISWQLDNYQHGANTASTPNVGISHIRLIVEEIDRQEDGQSRLWGSISDLDRLAVKGIERIKELLGPYSVLSGVINGGRGPSDRMSLAQWSGTTLKDSEQPPWPGHYPYPPPALIHRQLIPIEVLDANSIHVAVFARGGLSGSPAKMSLAGEQCSEIIAWAGPWLFDECWWDSSLHRRRARFQFLTSNKTAHMCVIEQGKWYLEATYD